MNRIRLFKVFSKPKLLEYHKISSTKLYSTKSAVEVSEKEDTNDEIIKQYEKISKITIKERKKSPQKPPFAKNLFLGIFDTDILAYPQLEKEEFEELEKEIGPVANYFNSVSSSFLQHPFLPNGFVHNLQQLRLFGLQCSQLLNGRELNVIENCKFNEVISNATSVTPSLLHNEHLGIQILLKNGTEDQQKKYLEQLTNGSILSAFCVCENDSKDLSVLNTTATFSKEHNAWVLNGRKTGVINGSTADLYIVIAQTSLLGKSGLREPQLTVVFIDKSSHGIKFQKSNTMGLEACDVADVIFDSVLVPEENIIGIPKGGDSIVASILTEYRLSWGPACSTLIRKLINNLVDHCKTVNMATTNISEADYIRQPIAEMTLSLYALESATYLTAGLLDFFENQDCLLESTIVKVFAAEEACKNALKCMDVLGSSAYLKDHWCNILLRDALGYRHLHESGENLKLGIALLGIQFSGVNFVVYLIIFKTTIALQQHIQGEISKIRNPLFHAQYILKRMWKYRKQGRDEPDLKLRLGDYLHPSAHEPSEFLEYSVLRLQYATEVFLARHGPEVINQHMELKKLAECVIDIYMMVAVLARASRSYCIGLENANYEMVLANTFCTQAKFRVRERINDIIVGPFPSGHESYKTIAKRVFKYKQYFPVHPLSRNY
ncbi:hypothetical protein FQR65_LT14713 [Abscondita terminalis]|nr:hypothetical protein FQR65_LT14713 [Abscondita terminalis]